MTNKRSNDGIEQALQHETMSSLGRWRAVRILAMLAFLTLPLIPVQAVFIRFAPKLSRWLPNWYHCQTCRILGLRLHVSGRVADNQATLLVSNHTSWLDILVLSAIAPVSFIAKKEVSRWPGVSLLAKLQNTIFVDRQRRMQVGQTTTEISERLAQGDNIVLFAEGTSSDGNRVLPFKTSLFAAAKPKKTDDVKPKDDSAGSEDESVMAHVQTVSVIYTRLHGVPFSRRQRSLVSWYGDMEMQGHVWELLKSGPIDIDIRITEPVALSAFDDRKVLARETEKKVRENAVSALRGLAAGHLLDVVEPERTRQHRVKLDTESDASAKKGWV